MTNPYSVKMHVAESEPYNTFLTLGRPELPSILKTLARTNDPVEIHFCCRALRKILSAFSTEDELREMISSLPLLGHRLINFMQMLQARSSCSNLSDMELDLQIELEWCLINITGVNNGIGEMRTLVECGLLEAVIGGIEFDTLGARCAMEVKRCQMGLVIVENVVGESDEVREQALQVLVEDFCNIGKPVSLLVKIDKVLD